MQITAPESNVMLPEEINRKIEEVKTRSNTIQGALLYWL